MRTVFSRQTRRDELGANNVSCARWSIESLKSVGRGTHPRDTGKVGVGIVPDGICYRTDLTLKDDRATDSILLARSTDVSSNFRYARTSGTQNIMSAMKGRRTWVLLKTYAVLSMYGLEYQWQQTAREALTRTVTCSAHAEIERNEKCRLQYKASVHTTVCVTVFYDVTVG